MHCMALELASQAVGRGGGGGRGQNTNCSARDKLFSMIPASQASEAAVRGQPAQVSTKRGGSQAEVRRPGSAGLCALCSASGASGKVAKVTAPLGWALCARQGGTALLTAAADHRCICNDLCPLRDQQQGSPASVAWARPPRHSEVEPGEQPVASGEQPEGESLEAPLAAWPTPERLPACPSRRLCPILAGHCHVVR